MSKRDKICWAMLLGLAVFILAAMMAVGQPVPPKPKPVLRSPKDTEFTKSLAKVAAPAVIIPPPNKFLIWDNTYGGTNVAFQIDHAVMLSPGVSAWTKLASVTNQFSYSISPTNSMEFFLVGAFWP